MQQIQILVGLVGDGDGLGDGGRQFVNFIGF